jgi:Galactose oxidase, central domain
MMSSRISLVAVTVVALVSFIACGGGSIGTKNFNTTFTIGGTVSGIPSGDSVILADNGSDVLTVPADGNFTFNKQIASGSTYNVTVQTPPPGETCNVTNASGTATANVTNVSVTCTATSSTFTITVSASGISGGGSLVVSDGIGTDLTFSGDGQQAFTDSYQSGATYAVTVTQQPTGEACTLSSNSNGTITANVTVTATCVSNIPTFFIGGTLSGLASGASVVLQDNATDNLTLAANGAFTFHSGVPAGSNYAVSVLTQPTGQTCSVSNGTGTVSANVTNVTVTCSGSGFSIGGTLSGLASGATVVLADNATFDTLSLTANGSFVFPKLIAGGSSYSVTVSTLPNGQSCTVTNGTGTANANVTNILVACVSQYTIGGTVSGLSSGGNLILDDNGAFDSLTIVENGAFEFGRTLAAGSAYAVAVATQPTGQTCTVTNGSGTANANVTNVTVVCAATSYTIGGTLSGLSGGTVVLQDNNADNLSLAANGTFQFATSVAAGSAYKVTVFAQPSGQACTVTNGSGTATGNVTNVQVTCATSTPLTVSVNTTGISGGGSLIVKDDQGPTLTFSADGNQTFTNTYASGASYSVTITQQPTGETCTLSSNSVGTITANVTITATCANSGNSFTISGTLYDLSANSSSTGLSLQNNNADTLTLTTNGPFTFATAVAGGSTYDVTVSSQPTNPSQNCTVSNGSGTATANVTNVQVVCVGNWIWVTGSDLVAVGGIYTGGTKYPGTRFGTTGWKDASGNFWLFGGFGYDSNGPKVSQTTGGSNESVLSDLWKFDGTGWSFEDGQSQTGQCFDYPAGLNQPGTPSARSNAVSWVDSSGNLWMFGGYVAHNVPGDCPQADAFNDLWEFIGGQWIWVGGASTPSQAGSYGTKGVASSTNIPGGRYYATGTTDSSGNFWLFGGYGVDSAGTLGYLNDLWKFDGTTWTWVAGSNLANVKGTYSGGSAAPGGRGGANSWIDSTGNFWVFGGDAIDSANFAGPMNDLWKIPLSGGQWTFVGGSTTNGAAGTYGIQGIPDPTNVPGTREFAMSWQAPSGDVWIFGGQRLGGAFYTDLWKYSSGQWLWMSGSQTVDSLGVYTGTPDQLEPGSRMQAAPWVDANGNLWMFGGYGMGLLPSGSSVHDGFDSLQDVWEFQP